MDEKATFEQIHNMVTQLITMVSKMQSDITTLKAGQERISDIVEAHSLQISRLSHDSAVLQIRQDKLIIYVVGPLWEWFSFFIFSCNVR